MSGTSSWKSQMKAASASRASSGMLSAAELRRRKKLKKQQGSGRQGQISNKAHSVAQRPSTSQAAQRRPLAGTAMPGEDAAVRQDALPPGFFDRASAQAPSPAPSKSPPTGQPEQAASTAASELPEGFFQDAAKDAAARGVDAKAAAAKAAAAEWAAFESFTQEVQATAQEEAAAAEAAAEDRQHMADVESQLFKLRVAELRSAAARRGEKRPRPDAAATDAPAPSDAPEQAWSLLTVADLPSAAVTAAGAEAVFRSAKAARKEESCEGGGGGGAAEDEEDALAGLELDWRGTGM